MEPGKSLSQIALGFLPFLLISPILFHSRGLGLLLSHSKPPGFPFRDALAGHLLDRLNLLNKNLSFSINTGQSVSKLFDRSLKDLSV